MRDSDQARVLRGLIPVNCTIIRWLKTLVQKPWSQSDIVKALSVHSWVSQFDCYVSANVRIAVSVHLDKTVQPTMTPRNMYGNQNSQDSGWCKKQEKFKARMANPR